MTGRESRKKSALLFGGLLFFLSPIFADRRPPQTMIGQPQAQQTVTFEIPVHDINTAGGVLDSFDRFGRNGNQISVSVGAFSSGRVTGSGRIVDFGPQVVTLFSDRIPVQNLVLTIEGREPGDLITNRPAIPINVTFTDDLAGLKSARIRESVPGGFDFPLNLNAPNIILYTIRGAVGDGNPTDGLYVLKFAFEDHAGNVTSPEREATITLDRAPPTTGTLTINAGDRFTSSTRVNVTLADSLDAGIATSGVRFARLSNTINEPRQWSDPVPLFQLPQTIPWRLEETTPIGTRTVLAQFQDGAGNWSVELASDTIEIGEFKPDGRLDFGLIAGKVIQKPDFVLTNQSIVNLIFTWGTGPFSDVAKVEMWGGWSPNDLENRRVITSSSSTFQDGRHQLVIPYQIAPEEGGDDRLRRIHAIFLDTQNNPSPEVSADIFFNQNKPDPPHISRIDVSSDSLTVSISTRAMEGQITFIRMEPSEVSGRNGADVFEIPWSTSAAFLVAVDTGLIPNTDYEYSLSSLEEFSLSDPVSILEVTEAEPPAFVSPPGGIETTVIQIAWGTRRNPPGTTYDLEWAETAFNDFEAPCAVCQKKLEVSGTPLLVEKLTLGTSYFFRVRAKNKVGVPTSFTDLGVGRTKDYVAPLAPAHFFADEISSTTVLWRWVRTPSTEDRFVLLDALENRMAEVPLTPLIDEYQFLEKDLTPNTTIFRKIIAENGFEGQAVSSPTVAELFVTRPAPPFLERMEMTGNRLHVEWKRNLNPDDTEFLVEIALNEEFTHRREDNGWDVNTEADFQGLQPATTYYVRGRARDRTKSFEATTLFGTIKTETHDHSRELDLANMVSGWRLVLPPQSLSQDFTLHMEGDPTRFQSTPMETLLRATEKARLESGGYRFLIPGGLIEISATTVEGEPLLRALNEPGNVSYSYPDSFPRDQIVDKEVPAAEGQKGPQFFPQLNQRQDMSKEIRVSTLRIWFLDKQTQSWFRVPNNGVDLVKELVGADVKTFGVFAVMGASSLDVSQVIAFPVPFRPNGPNAGDTSGKTGTDGTGITFSNLPQEGQIQIFDLRGRRVQKLVLTGGISHQWDTRNQSGEKAASGTYFYLTEAGGNRKTGKLMIIR